MLTKTDFSKIIKIIEDKLNSIEKQKVVVITKDTMGNIQQIEKEVDAVPNGRYPFFSKNETSEIIQLIALVLNEVILYSNLTEKSVNEFLKDFYIRLNILLTKFNQERKRKRVIEKIPRAVEQAEDGEPLIKYEEYEFRPFDLNEINILTRNITYLLEGILKRAENGREKEFLKDVLNVDVKEQKQEDSILSKFQNI